jgi:CMP-2-keto-3-deoxyoctulosonic acid synthetase
MTNTIAQAMKDGQSLTSMRKQFLQTFCSTPGVIKRQREELERAVLRQAAAQKRFDAARAQGAAGEAVDKSEVDIQRAIYNALR